VLIVRENALLAVAGVGVVLSDTPTVKFDVPLPVGVPEITPPALIDRPAGSDPEVIDHVYAPLPPVVARAAEYAIEVVPEGSGEEFVIESAGAMANENASDTALGVGVALSVTVTVKLAVPLALGSPLITPVELARLSPPGRLPEVIDHVYGAVPPVACKVYE